MWHLECGSKICDSYIDLLYSLLILFSETPDSLGFFVETKQPPGKTKVNSHFDTKRETGDLDISHCVMKISNTRVQIYFQIDLAHEYLSVSKFGTINID